MSDVVGDRTELLHLLSKNAVECEAGLEKTDVARAKTDLFAYLSSQLSQRLVVGPDLELVLSHIELLRLLYIGTSEHLFFNLVIIIIN